VPDVHVPQSRESIEVTLPLGIPDPNPLPTNEDERSHPPELVQIGQRVKMVCDILGHQLRGVPSLDLHRVALLASSENPHHCSRVERAVSSAQYSVPPTADHSIVGDEAAQTPIIAGRERSVSSLTERLRMNRLGHYIGQPDETTLSLPFASDTVRVAHRVARERVR
jgi:hypothetical protein